MGAAAWAVCGGCGAPPRPPRPWACRLAATSKITNAAFTKGTARVMARFATRLIERLTLAAPLPSVRRTRDVHHAHAVVVGIAAGLAHYDHMIACLETLAGDALA